MKIPKSLKIRWAILGWLLCILSLNFILPLSSGEDSEFQFKNGQTSPISAQTNISQSAASPLPSKGEITGERNIFYWLHITDTQAMWESESQKLWYSQFITDVYDLIQPKMIINTGDLVNSDYHGIFNEHSGQRSWEWETYKSLNDAAGMNNRTLYDVL